MYTVHHRKTEKKTGNHCLLPENKSDFIFEILNFIFRDKNQNIFFK